MQNKMPVNPVIRPLTENDVPLFIDFFESLSLQSHTFFNPHGSDAESLEDILKEIPRNPKVRRFMLSLVENGQESMIGYVFFWDWHKKVPWFGIGLRDAYHGQGLGTRMMNFAIDFARQHGKGGILLTTAKTNIRAQGLYKKSGYILIGDAPDGEYLMILNFEDENV